MQGGLFQYKDRVNSKHDSTNIGGMKEDLTFSVHTVDTYKVWSLQPCKNCNLLRGEGGTGSSLISYRFL